MRSVNQFYKDIITTRGKQYNFLIKVDGEEYNADNVFSLKPFYESPLFKTTLTGIEIELSDNLVAGSAIEVQNTPSLDDKIGNTITFNNYRTIKDLDYNADTGTYSGIAYDRMVESMIDYDLKLENEMKLRDYLIAIFNRLNWDTKNIPVEFINSEKPINPMLHQDIDYTFRDALDEICTLGCFFMTYIDEPRIIYPVETNTNIDESGAITEDLLNEDSVEILDEFKINSLVFSRAAESDSIYRNDLKDIEENGLHEYKISDNQLLSTNDRDLYIDEMFEYLRHFSFHSFDIQTIQIMIFEPLDMFKIKIADKFYKVLLLNYDLDLIEDTEHIYADLPEETQTDYKSASKSDKEKNQTYILVDKQNQKISQVASRVTENTSDIARIGQDVQTIRQEVKSVSNFSKEKTGIDELILDNTAFEKNLILDLEVFGNTSYWKALTPSENLEPSNFLVPFGDSITIICDKNPKGNLSNEYKSIKIFIHEPLRNIDNIMDKLTIKGTKVEVERNIYVDENGNLQIRTLPVIEELEDLPEALYTFDNRTYVYIKEYSNLRYFTRYVTKNDFTEVFATQTGLDSAVVDLESSITQTAENIQLQVSKKVGANEIISAINQSAEEISINASRVKLEGYTSINDGFSVDKKGNFTANSGKIGIFNIQSNGNLLAEKDGKHLEMGNDEVGVVYNDVNKAQMYLDRFGNAVISVQSGAEKSYMEGSMVYSGGSMSATGYNTRSLESLKENIEKYEKNALEIVKNSEIYSYNYKGNQDKHIGFVINDLGGNYKTPEDVISSNKQAIELYAMASILWKAVQELSEEIKKIKGEKDG